jgi:hypothetical protein
LADIARTRIRLVTGKSFLVHEPAEEVRRKLLRATRQGNTASLKGDKKRHRVLPSMVASVEEGAQPRRASDEKGRRARDAAPAVGALGEIPFREELVLRAEESWGVDGAALTALTSGHEKAATDSSDRGGRRGHVVRDLALIALIPIFLAPVIVLLPAEGASKRLSVAPAREAAAHVRERAVQATPSPSVATPPVTYVAQAPKKTALTPTPHSGVKAAQQLVPAAAKVSSKKTVVERTTTSVSTATSVSTSSLHLRTSSLAPAVTGHSKSTTKPVVTTIIPPKHHVFSAPPVHKHKSSTAPVTPLSTAGPPPTTGSQSTSSQTSSSASNRTSANSKTSASESTTATTSSGTTSSDTTTSTDTTTDTTTTSSDTTSTNTTTTTTTTSTSATIGAGAGADCPVNTVRSGLGGCVSLWDWLAPSTVLG